MKNIFSTAIATVLCMGTSFAQIIPSTKRVSLSGNDKAILDKRISKFTAFTIDKKELADNLYITLTKKPITVSTFNIFDMKQIILFLISIYFSASLFAQEEQRQAPKFKPRYAGTSVNTGYMWTPNFGSAFYVAPKLNFQATPRLFVNTGISVVQYNLLPSQMKSDGSGYQRTATGAYIFAEGVYLLNERWSVNGSVMKDISPEPMRRATPYRMPSEAAHFGVDYKITPSITVGARIGYSNGGRNNIYSPFLP